MIPESEAGGLHVASSTELPSKRIIRLKQELDDLEQELKLLEKEEIPTQIKNDEHSSKYQMI